MTSIKPYDLGNYCGVIIEEDSYRYSSISRIVREEPRKGNGPNMNFVIYKLKNVLPNSMHKNKKLRERERGKGRGQRVGVGDEDEGRPERVQSGRKRPKACRFSMRNHLQ